MEREANYVAVGAFILLVTAMAVAFVIWYSDANDGREYERYEIHFAGSVSGLNRGSPVRYLGVDVGRVRRLYIDKQDASRVIAVVDIDEDAPISSATRASLNLQGVTGLLYINLKEAAYVDTTKPLRRGRQYPLIESVASEFDVFLASVPELMGRVNSILERVTRVLSDDNLAGVADTIKSIRTATATLPETSAKIALLVDDLRTTMAEVNAAAQSIRSIAQGAEPQLAATFARFNEVADSLAQASARIERLSRRSEVQLGHFTEQGLFELERLVREARTAAQEFRDLSRNLQDNPSRLIYEPQPSGVEIRP